MASSGQGLSCIWAHFMGTYEVSLALTISVTVPLSFLTAPVSTEIPLISTTWSSWDSHGGVACYSADILTTVTQEVLRAICIHTASFPLTNYRARSLLLTVACTLFAPKCCLCFDNPSSYLCFSKRGITALPFAPFTPSTVNCRAWLLLLTIACTLSTTKCCWCFNGSASYLGVSNRGITI